ALHLGKSIIKKHHFPPAQLSQIGHHLAMTTGPQDCQALHLSPPVKRLMVTCPSALMPSRTNTFLTVNSKIRMSSHKERLSTYHTSSANFSGQLSALRPFTCAQPVMPG